MGKFCDNIAVQLWLVDCGQPQIAVFSRYILGPWRSSQRGHRYE
jgi:hypothetical protein